MTIDKTNAMFAELPHLHDAIFTGFVFERTKRCLQTVVELDAEIGAKLSITFENVIGFTMSHCDYWGASPYISFWDIVDKTDRKLIRTLFEKCLPQYINTALKNEDDYIEMVMEFISGDYFRVACETVSIERSQHVVPSKSSTQL